MSEAVTSPLTLEERLKALEEAQADCQFSKSNYNHSPNHDAASDAQFALLERMIEEEKARLSPTPSVDYSPSEVLARLKEAVNEEATSERIKAAFEQAEKDFASIRDASRPSVDYSGGLRVRLEAARADAVKMGERTPGEPFGWEEESAEQVKAFDTALAMLDEENAKVTASLALLKEPRVGTTVTGEGFEWVYDYAGNHLDWFAHPFDSYVQRHEDVIPLLRALVSSGAAYVKEGADA